MRKHILLFSALLLLCIAVQAQLPKIWDKRYGGSGSEYIMTIVSIKNGNLLIGGWSPSNISGDKTAALYGSYDYWIVCSDSDGNKLWDASFGGNSSDELSVIIQTKDGGFLIGGTSISGISGTKTQASQGGEDYWIVKTDSSGNYQWDKRFGGSSDDELTSICNTHDGGYLLAGLSESGANGDKTQSSWGGADYWIVKIDSMGTMLWDKRFGGSGTDYCYSAYQTTDHGYILSGYSSSGISGDKSQSSWGSYDYWVVRIDSVGTKIWDKRFGTGSSDYARAGVSDGHDGVVIGGFTSGGISGDKTQSSWGSDDYWLVHVDSIGIKVWDARFGGNEDDDSYGNIFRCSDGGYISTGTSYSDISGNKTQNNLGVEQTWMVKCDSNGHFIVDRTLLTTGHEETGFSTVTEGGCIIIGNNTSVGIGGDKSQNSQGSSDYFIAKYCAPGLPLADFTTPDTTLCQGQCIAFSDVSYNYPSTWSWSFPGGTPSFSNLQNPTICYNSVGTFDVQLIVTNMSGTDTIIHSAYITVTVQITPPVIVQNGTLLTCTPAASTYQWYFNYISIPGATDQTYNATQTGLYSVMVSNGFGCSAVSPAFSFNINVSLANFSVSDTLICENSCLDFTDASLNNPASWAWSFPGGVPSSSTQQNPGNICYYAGGTYTVTLTVSNQYGQSILTYVDYIHVLSNPFSPVIAQNGDTLFCLSVDSNYQWYFNGSIIPGATGPWYVATQNGLYEVSVANSDGCSAKSAAYTFYLSVVAAFSVSDSSFCQGACLDFYDLSLNSPTDWLWSFPGGVPSASTQQNPSGICYNTPGIYQVTLIASTAYSQSTLTQNSFITVIDVPSTPVITQFYDTLFCNSISVQYQWLHDGIPVPGATNAYYIMPVSGNYSVEITNAGGCSANTTFDAVIPLPAFASQDSMVCEKLCTNFFDLSNNNPVWWLWIFEGGTPSSSFQQNPTDICYHVPGIYDVTLITNDGYKYDTLILQDHMTVFPTPTLPSITITGDTLLSTPAFAYQWLLDGVAIAGATNQLYVANQSGVYTIITYSGDGCTSQVSAYFDLTGISTLNKQNVFEIFPNPGSGIFTLKFHEAEIQPLNWYLSDVLGRIVHVTLPADDHSSKEIILDLTSEKDGLYFIHVCYNDVCPVKKIIKHSSE